MGERSIKKNTMARDLISCLFCCILKYMSYIYHIHSKIPGDKSGVYIGQTTQPGYIRPVDHFRSGYRGRGENPLFQDFLKGHSFDEMEVEIFAAPDYGLDPEELDAFLLE